MAYRKKQKSFTDMMKQLFDGLRNDHPDIFTPDIIDPVEKHCSTPDAFYYANTVHKEINMVPVLVHGDLWINNLMLKKETKDGVSRPTNELLAIVDWQVRKDKKIKITVAGKRTSAERGVSGRNPTIKMRKCIGRGIEFTSTAQLCSTADAFAHFFHSVSPTTPRSALVLLCSTRKSISDSRFSL